MCRTRTACGRQRWNDGICACCVLRTWYMSELCAHSSGEPRGETDNVFTDTSVRTYKIRPLVLKPGKSSYLLPPETTFNARRALQSARIALRPRPMCPAGLPCVRVLSPLPEGARTNRKASKTTKNYKHTYTSISSHAQINLLCMVL